MGRFGVGGMFERGFLGVWSICSRGKVVGEGEVVFRRGSGNS